MNCDKLHLNVDILTLLSAGFRQTESLPHNISKLELCPGEENEEVAEDVEFSTFMTLAE